MIFFSKRVFSFLTSSSSSLAAPAGSPSCGKDVAVNVLDVNQPNLPTPFYSVLVFSSVFIGLLTVFHSINSHEISSLCRRNIVAGVK